MYFFIRVLQTLTFEPTECCNYYLEGIGNVVIIIIIIWLRSRRLQIASNRVDIGLTRRLHPGLNHYQYPLAVSVVNWCKTKIGLTLRL